MKSPNAVGTPYRRITVPLDATRESEQALRWALHIARRAHCVVDLVHVVTIPPAAPELYGVPIAVGGSMEDAHAVAQHRLSRLAHEIDRHAVRAETTLLEGGVPSALADHVNASNTDLVVMTSHDKGRIAHFLYGSASESLARRAHVPVLVVHATADEVSFDKPVEVRRVLVPIDGSELSEQIVTYAGTFAKLMRAEVTVIGVLQPILAVANAALDTGPDPVMPLAHAPSEAPHDRASTPQLDRAASAIHDATGLTVDTVVLSDGKPARAIVEYADHNDVDVIAMATHGRGALQRAIMGSVAEHVLRHSRLPLLLYRPE